MRRLKQVRMNTTNTQIYVSPSLVVVVDWSATRTGEQRQSGVKITWKQMTSSKGPTSFQIHTLLHAHAHTHGVSVTELTCTYNTSCLWAVCVCVCMYVWNAEVKRTHSGWFALVSSHCASVPRMWVRLSNCKACADWVHWLWAEETLPWRFFGSVLLLFSFCFWFRPM